MLVLTKCASIPLGKPSDEKECHKGNNEGSMKTLSRVLTSVWWVLVFGKLKGKAEAKNFSVLFHQKS